MTVYQASIEIWYYWLDAYQSGYQQHEKLFSTKEKAEQYLTSFQNKYYDINNKLVLCDIDSHYPKNAQIIPLEID